MTRTIKTLILLLAATTVHAQLAAPSVPRASIAPTDVAQMQWREIGPGSMGGRIVDIEIDRTNPDTWYVGAASGGVWKTTDAGTTFEGLFQYEDVNTIGDVAVSRSHPNVVWVGTGEQNPRNSSIYGNGVYKSTDGGRTWTNMGLQATRHIGRMAVHHTDPDVVYVGAMGRTWGPNEERGLFKTTDGGKTWNKLLFVNDQTGVIEVVMHPTDPDTLLVATWQRQRDIYDVGEPAVSDGEGSAVWLTTDGGRNWTRLGEQNGLPTGRLGRTGITWSQSDPNTVFLITGGARLPGTHNGVWKSTNGGRDWTKVNGIAPRPMYYSQIRVDPRNPDVLFVLGVQLARSTDGGANFANVQLRGVHVDHHALEFHPDDSKKVLLGNDGGFYVSGDGGDSFAAYKKMSLGQFYHVAVDDRRDYWIAGGLQDNGTWYGPSMTRGDFGTRNEDYRSINGGDGFVARFDPTDRRIVFAESQNGNVRRHFFGPRDEAPTGTVRRPRVDGERETWAWKTDFIVSRHDPKVFYIGGQYVYKSTDRGVDAVRISPKMPLTERGSITAVMESPLDPKVLYAGTDDGALFATRDGGTTWTAVHDNVGVPVRCYVSTLEASRYSPGRVYAAFDGHRSDDDRPFIYVSDDYGQTWSEIVGDLPEFGSTRCLREDPMNENLLYCGTEFFAFASIDRGQTWTKINNNLPTVAVHDFAISEAANELVAGTHGRSVWAVDVSWLRQLTALTNRADMYLFQPHSAVLWTKAVDQPVPEKGTLVGQNPYFGATIYFRVETPRAVRVRVYDKDGFLAYFGGVDAHAGLNKVHWDLGYGDGRVPAGDYRVEIQVGSQTTSRTLTVLPDPVPVEQKAAA